jgi:hypothetical protein
MGNTYFFMLISCLPLIISGEEMHYFAPKFMGYNNMPIKSKKEIYSKAFMFKFHFQLTLHYCKYVSPLLYLLNASSTIFREASMFPVPISAGLSNTPRCLLFFVSLFLKMLEKT